MTRRRPRILWVALLVNAALLPLMLGDGADARPSTVWRSADVRVNDPRASFGGRQLGVREPAVAVDPGNPNRMVLAAIDKSYSHVNGYGSWAGAVHVYRSTNAGGTWRSSGVLVGPNNAGEWSSGDPTVVFDGRGTAWVAMLADQLAMGSGRFGSPYSTRGGIYVYRSDDGGATWKGPFQAVARTRDEANRRCEGTDKELIAANRKTGELLIAYTLFHTNCATNQIEAYLNLATGEDIEILLVRSKDRGRTWSAPQRIWHGYAYGAQPAVGPDGTIYVALSSAVPVGPPVACPSALDSAVARFPSERNLIVASSNDDGATWRYERRPQCDPALLPSESSAGLGGAIPSISVDPSTGRAYVAWPTFAAGLGYPAFSIQSMTSADGGRNWSPTVRITPPGRVDSLLPSIAAGRGRATAMWLATPDRGETFNVFAAETVDGGRTWSTPQRLNTASFSGSDELGDYNWIDVAGNRVIAVWTDLRSGTATDIYARVGTRT